MKILVIEDEQHLRKAIATGLKRFSYAVDCAADGEEGLELSLTNFYDAIILDLNLPKIDGVKVLSEIRKVNKDVKVIILSARSEIEDIVNGLDTGANDYIVKPFHFKVLEARIRALLRRKFSVDDVIISIGQISLDTAKKTAYYKDKELRFTKKEYSILEYLFVNKDRVVSTEEIIEHIWDSDANLYSNSYKVHLNSLKGKLLDFLDGRNIIKNVRGIGYYIEWQEENKDI